MKAVVFHGIGDIRLDSVKEPKIKEANDAIALTTSAICGTACTVQLRFRDVLKVVGLSTRFSSTAVATLP